MHLSNFEEISLSPENKLTKDSKVLSLMKSAVRSDLNKTSSKSVGVVVDDQCTHFLYPMIFEVYSGDDPTPQLMEINSDEIREAMMETINTIIEAVRIALERTPPELAADIVDKGIVLAGGGAEMKNFDILLQQETGLPVVVAEDPLSCVVLGSGQILDQLDLLKQVAISS